VAITIKNMVLKALFIAAAIVAVALLLYPTVSNWINGRSQSRVVMQYLDAVQNADQEFLDNLLKEAHAYNKDLIEKEDRFSFSDEEWEEYRFLLDTGDGLMGVIRIEKIGVNLPIYHGVDADTLQAGIGHFPGTSLPVGGVGTHAFITGHRGLPSSELLSSLDKMAEGDTFMIHVLGETLTYEVDKIQTILPEDLSAVTITRDADYVTLLTCTPYGINTHRLLVRGHRVPNMNDSAQDAIYADAKHSRDTAVLLVAFITVASIATAVINFRNRTASKGRCAQL